MIFPGSKRERILIFKFISDALWTANRLMSGGYTGALLNDIAMGREVVFYNRDKRKWGGFVLWMPLWTRGRAKGPFANSAPWNPKSF